MLRNPTLDARPTILVADDDADVCRTVELLLQTDYDVKTALSVRQAQNILDRSQVDVAIVDLNFEGQDRDGLSLVRYVLSSSPRTKVIVRSNDTNTKRVSDSMRLNIFEFVAKDELDERLLNRVEAALLTIEAMDAASAQFLTRSPLMRQELLKVEKLVSHRRNIPVLITGPSGSGKEYLSRYLAYRLRKKMRATNMANVEKDTAESILFGHVKGSFTGAYANHTGLFELSHNNVLFLDEIGESSLAVQAKLLRAVQEGEISPIGSQSTKQVDVQLITATNRNLSEMVAAGSFRDDLLHRLSTFVLKIPALRERPEDIAYYSELFLSEISEGRPFSIEPSGMDALLSYSWPGNVRQLRNAIERIVILSDERRLSRASVEEALSSIDQLQDFEGTRVTKVAPSQELIIDALKKVDGNRTRAAKLLNVHRSTLIRWLNEFGLSGTVAATAGRPVKQEA